jgi:signal transduction histidine kinase
VIAWLIAPTTVGVSQNPLEIRTTYLVASTALVYLLIRSWFTFRPHTAVRWEYVWPVADVVLISVALLARVKPQGSWLMLLYLFPIMQAASTLSVRWALGIGALSVTAYLSACGLGGLEPLRYGYGIFRLFFLLLMASLVTSLGREVVRAHRESALNDYRTELAAEMHDGIQQYLAAISMRLELARALVNTNPGEAARIAVDQRHLARQAADELRVMVRGLRSPVLEGGIANALRHYVGLLGNRSDLPIEFGVTGDEARLDPRTEHAILRVVQEALTNVVKHASAGSVRVGLEFAPGEVICTVADDGVGFDVGIASERQVSSECCGLENMRRRAAGVNGSLQISSTPGKGSTVLLRIPR